MERHPNANMAGFLGEVVREKFKKENVNFSEI
jgi:hypothetical protein